MPLHSLHDAQKVVHRDVRPDNMLPGQHHEVLAPEWFWYRREEG
jgi:hypothetical protein